MSRCVVASALLAALLAGGVTETAGAANAPAGPQPAARRTAIAALLRAATEGDPRGIESLIRSGAPVDGRSPRGEGPLQAAAAAGRNSNVFSLLALGADIDALGTRGTTALGWAARNGHEPVVRTLLDSGAGPDAAADPPHSPLALAVTNGHRSISALLIERGSKVFEKPELAAAVLIALSEANGLKLSDLLVPRMTDLLASSSVVRQAAADAIVNSNATFSKTIRQQLGAAIHTRDFQTALLLSAVRRRRHDLASEAIEGGADIDAKHPTIGTPLSIAMALGDSGMVSLLLAADVDWKRAGIEEHRIRSVVGDNDNDRLAASLAEKIGVHDLLDQDGETLVFRAAQRGDFLGVKRLLSKNSDPAATVKRWPGDRGWTALMTAAAQGQHAIVELLIRSGAPVDQRNAAGRTALSFAAFYGRSSVVAVLLGAGADPDAADAVGQTPVMLAEASGDITTQQMIRAAPRAHAPASASGATSPSSPATSPASPATSPSSPATSPSSPATSPSSPATASPATPSAVGTR